MIFPVRKTLSGRRAVVIGSGAGGLSAAISLAVRGARVIVLEKSDAPGPSFRSIKLGNFRFDQTLSHAIDPHVLVELFASADQRTSDFVALHRRNPICRFLFHDKSYFDLSHEREEFEEQVTRLDAQDGKKLMPYLRHCRSIAVGLQTYRRAYALEGGKVWSRWKFSRVAGELLSPFSYKRKIYKTFRNPKLRAMLLSMRALSGISPCAPGAFSEDFLARFHEHGGWYIDGGGEAMLAALLRLCDLLGVKIATHASVEKIELEGGRVRKVIGEGFSPIAASIVVSNSEPFERLGRFLPKLDDVEPKIRSAWKHKKAGTRCVLLAGATDHFDSVIARTVLVSEDTEEESRFADKWKVPASMPSLLVERGTSENGSAAPAGEMALTVRAFAPPSSTRFQWSETQNQEARDTMIAILEQRGLEKARTSITESRFLSPASQDAGENMFDQDAGYEASSMRLLSRIPKNRVKEVPGLYLASGYSFPGPGFMNEIVAGMIAAVCASEDGE